MLVLHMPAFFFFCLPLIQYTCTHLDNLGPIALRTSSTVGMAPGPEKTDTGEKDGSLGDGEHTSSGPPSISSGETKERHDRPPTRESRCERSKAGRRSRSSRREQGRSERGSEDSDPLSPLGIALSHGSQGFDEIAHVRTTTSVGSSRSRPPDFEVAFSDDDAENPRYWPLVSSLGATVYPLYRV